MLGGLMCEQRRHSEATPAMKPVKKMSVPPLNTRLVKLSAVGKTTAAATSNGIIAHGSSVPLPMFSSSSCSSSASSHANANNNSTTTPSVFLKHQPSELLGKCGEDGEEADEPIEFTGECMRIGDGKYEFWDTPASLVGRGSYGIVFRGVCLSPTTTTKQQHNEDNNEENQQQQQHKSVAIKRMWRVNVQSDELEAMKCVRNENLVLLLAVCDEPGEISYLVMELCDTDLDKHLRAAPGGKVVAPADMKVLVESVARGYFALFEKHIVHRDIKPQNILLLYDNNTNEQNNNNSKQLNGTTNGWHRRAIRSAKITDFGVSRVLADEHMGLCNVAGTLLFMAPEVGANLVAISEYDHSADMWSVGCLLFQCLTGRTPFDEASLCRLFLYCAGGNFDAYEEPELPDDMMVVNGGGGGHTLGALIHSLLQLDRTKRATPRELLEAAENANNGNGNGTGICSGKNGMKKPPMASEKKKCNGWR